MSLSEARRTLIFWYLLSIGILVNEWAPRCCSITSVLCKLPVLREPAPSPSWAW